MTAFLDDNFLLSNDISQKLYHQYGAPQPIVDYHCHLSPKDIAENRRFDNLYEIWLEGDHYKWRAMRANGVAERYITGDASPYEKFLAWARTVPYTLRNPLYHWTHLELRRYFEINDLLDESSAPKIWERANAALAQDLTTHGILKKFRVEVVCTTDDPTDDLRHHKAIAKSGLETRVFPAFRPDKALAIGTPEFLPWVENLSKAADVEIRNLTTFEEALKKRHEAFHALGCRLSDHGLNHAFGLCSEQTAASIFAKARDRKPVSEEQAALFASFMMCVFGRLDKDKGWTKQLHLGALRNVNWFARRTIGPDTGYDTVGDFPQIRPLAAYLNTLASSSALPRTILYNNNPSDTFAFATLIGCFQDGKEPGKIQYGGAWWFLDQKEGIIAQLNALSNVGLLSRFIGMVTDSRSFMSYPRHEYFRRILCDVVGQDVVRGELPNDEALLARLVEDVSYRNATAYLKLPQSDSAAKTSR